MYTEELKQEYFEEFMTEAYSKLVDGDFAVLNTCYRYRIDEVVMIMHVISLDRNRDITKLIGVFEDFDCRIICGFSCETYKQEWVKFIYNKLCQIEDETLLSGISASYKYEIENIKDNQIKL